MITTNDSICAVLQAKMLGDMYRLNAIGIERRVGFRCCQHVFNNILITTRKQLIEKLYMEVR